MFGLKKRTWIIGAVVAAVIGTGAVASRYQNASLEDRADFASYMITKKLELNDSQEASLDSLVKTWIGSAGTMKAFRKSMLDDVKSLAGEDNISVAQVNALRDKIKAEIDLRADKIIPEFVAFYNGLNTKQKTLVSARLDKVSERMEKGGFRRHWGHRGGYRGEHRGGKYRDAE